MLVSGEHFIPIIERFFRVHGPAFKKARLCSRTAGLLLVWKLVASVERDQADAARRLWLLQLIGFWKTKIRTDTDATGASA
jgi:hypothetical protein